MVARQAVRAVGGDHQHAQLRERLPQRAEQLERRPVGPLEVVEDDERAAVPRQPFERAADGLEQRRAVRGRSGLSELRQDEREVRDQRAAAGEAVALGAEVGAQRADHGAVRDRDPGGGEATQD